MKLAAGVLFLALASIGCGQSTPELRFEAATVVFPDTVIDHRADGTKSITLTNHGDDEVAPTVELTSYNDFAIARTTCTSLAPGESCDVVVRFEPHTLGARTVDLVAHVDGSSVAVTLAGSALPEPGLSAMPTSALHYEDVEVGDIKTLELTVRNGSAVTARPFTVAIIGPDAADFTRGDDWCSGAATIANGTCRIAVNFAPSTPSARSAELVVSSGNLGTQTIALDGNGFIPATLSVTPDSGMFGSVFAYGDGTTQSFTVTNAGTLPSPTLRLAKTGPNASYFALTDGCSGSALAGGASCMFSIVYRPIYDGMHEATVAVIAAPLADLLVPLTGTGIPPQTEITPSGWDFGRVWVGQPADDKTLTVKNTGATNTGPLDVGIEPQSTFAIAVDGCTGVDLAPAATCTLGVAAKPMTRGGSAALFAVHAMRGDRVVSSLQVTGIIAATLTPSLAAAAFGDVQLTETPRLTIGVSNMGDLATGAISVATVGADSADVTVVETCSGRSLEPFSGCSLTVSISPSHLGPETASIEITSPGATLTIPVTATTLPAPMFTVSPDTTVLNPVAVGASYPLTFVVQGTGAATGPLGVNVTGANAADYAITDDDCAGVILASGQACTVTLTLTPSATGSRDAVLVIAGTPGGYRRVPVKGIAFTQARLTASQPAVMFAATSIGLTNTFGFVTFKNTGQLPTGTLTAQLVGPESTQFGVLADTCTGATLAPNASCSVHTQFAPTNVASSTASLVVSAAPGGTVTLALTGTGLPPPVLASPITAYEFPAQETFMARDAAIRLENVGGSPMDSLRATFSGPQANSFKADASTCFAVGAGSGCNVRITFDPTDVGQATATLVIESPLAGSVTIAVRGTATPGIKVIVSPDSHDFGFVAAGDSSTATSFVATNIGQRDVTMFDTFVPSGCDNFEVVSTTCGSTLPPAASCQTDVVFHPVSSSFGYCRLVFVEDTLVRGEAALLGQTSL